ncbi:MAG: helix-turn-helix domain-containing protein, partial [Pseudotabrizicola sp.]
MTAAVDRTFAVLELLSRYPKGLSVQAVALSLAIVPSATHRLLNDLVRLGYASQSADQGTYALTLRLAATGLSWLGR